MNIEEDLIKQQQRIQDYLKGSMSPEERLAFEENLETDKALSKEVRLFQEINFVLKEESLIKTSQQVWKDIQANPIAPDFDLVEFEQNIVAERGFWSQWSTWLGGLLLVVALGGFFLWQLQPTAYEAVALNHLEPFENVVNSGEQASILANAMAAYDEGAYSKAIQSLKTYTAETFSQEAALYLGISYILNKEAEKAIPVLTPIAIGEEVFATTAQWYLALAFIYENQQDQAIPLLKKLQDDVIWGNKTRELLSELL